MVQQPTLELRQIKSEVDRFVNTLWVNSPTTNDLRSITALIARLRELVETHGPTSPWGPKFEAQLQRARKQRRRMRSTHTVERDRETARIRRAQERRAERQKAAAAEHAKRAALRSVLPAGMVRSSGLVQGRHEVLGGLPGTSRRH